MRARALTLVLPTVLWGAGPARAQSPLAEAAGENAAFVNVPTGVVPRVDATLVGAEYCARAGDDRERAVTITLDVVVHNDATRDLLVHRDLDTGAVDFEQDEASGSMESCSLGSMESCSLAALDSEEIPASPTLDFESVRPGAGATRRVAFSFAVLDEIIREGAPFRVRVEVVPWFAHAPRATARLWEPAGILWYEPAPTPWVTLSLDPGQLVACSQ